MKESPEYVPAAQLNEDLKLTWQDIKTWNEAPVDSEASSIIIKDLYSSASDIIAGLRAILSVPQELQITRRNTDVLGQLASSC